MRRIFSVLLTLLLTAFAASAQDSLNMSCLSRIEYWQNASDVQVVGNLAYIVCPESGLHIMDLSNPTAPVEIGRYLRASETYICGGVYVTGNRAYLATGEGLIILDVTNPSHPLALNQPNGVPYSDILVHNGFAIILDGGGDVSYPFFLDVSNPSDIHEGIVQAPDFERSTTLIGVTGDYFCLYRSSNRGNLFSIFRVDSMHQLQVVSDLDVGGYVSNGTIVGNYAYLASFQNGLTIVNITDPYYTAIDGQCECGSYADVSVINGHAIVINNGATMDIWNVSNPENIVQEGSFNPNTYLRRVFASGSTAYLMLEYAFHSVLGIDISQPAAPVAIDSFGTVGDCQKIARSGTNILLADRIFGMRTLDFSDPEHVVELDQAPIPVSSVYDLKVRDTIAYLAEFNYVHLFDIRDPLNPELISSLRNFCYSPTVAVYGNYIYTYRNIDGIVCGYLKTFNCQNPEAPVCVDSAYMNNPAMRLSVVNDLLFVYQGNVGLLVYSLTNPESPQLLGTYPSSWGHYIKDYCVVANIAYLCLYEEYIKVVDFSDPAQPAEVGEIQEYAQHISSHGATLAIATEQGLKMLDVSNYQNPVVTGYYTNDDWINCILMDDQYVLTASGAQFTVYRYGTLGVHPVSQSEIPNAYKLYAAYPNPFNPTTQIEFDMRQAGHVSVNVYNLLGQRVTTLINGNVTQGQHSVVFDAQNLPSGMYIYRMETNGFNEQKKMMLVK